MVRSGLAFVVVLSVLAAGCWKKDESLAKSAGSKVGETLTNFTSGVGAGIDRGLAVPLELAPEVRDQGLSKTVSKWEKGALVVYVISKDKLDVHLVAKAFNASGEEIGRSKLTVAFEQEDARYLTFKFPEEMDASLLAKCVIEGGK